MRPVVSYDDITAPSTNNGEKPGFGGAQQPQQPQLGPQLPSTLQPPTKRRRTNHNHSQSRTQHQQNSRQHQYVQHWDEPGGSGPKVNYGGGEDEEVGEDVGEGGEEGENEDEDEDEESRVLTKEEIWDDSALIDAWNSASAEYESFHGKGNKSWKEEPVKRSPLWYNIPPEPSKSKVSQTKGKATVTNGIAPTFSVPEVPAMDESIAEFDSQPLDFNTYVPTHDPSLTPLHPPGVPGPDFAQYYMPPLQGPMVGQDEAFQRALSAMYWGGYWTAVYHYQRQSQSGAGQSHGEDEADGDDEEMQEEGGDDYVSTQR
ncbi:hypothetical protein BXZ70DRAFT_891485 [Cristinia sonorae]|uniref:Survival Motor Neuron Gemin2-binding domain-containing protein n=1 Tax=Cristinia sonorae TaxID=1940300 RepID=A0A8K0XQX5_9AGAR|nr:hypothetical protein BXZ70DRAFT_891485 [Cristinia sonorae]